MGKFVLQIKIEKGDKLGEKFENIGGSTRKLLSFGRFCCILFDEKKWQKCKNDGLKIRIVCRS